VSNMNLSLREMQEERLRGRRVRHPLQPPGSPLHQLSTAPVWSDAYGPGDFEAAMQTAEKETQPVSLYMHLPFCESLCLFCACNVIIRKDKGVTPPYLERPEKKRSITSPAGFRAIARFRNSTGAAERPRIFRRNR